MKETELALASIHHY